MYMLLTLCAVFPALEAATTLKDAFMAAKANMEMIKKAESVVEQKEDRKDRARAAMLPNISGVGNVLQIDPPKVKGVSSAFTLTRQYSAGFRLQQPLLRGGMLAAFQLADEDILLSQFQKSATDLSLYQLVINSYYNLYMARADMANLDDLLRYSRERVKELQERTRVGRSRQGELVQAQAQLLTAQVQFDQGNINLKSAEENFRFYTQKDPDDLAPLEDLPKELEDFNSLLSKVRSRPDIMARQQQVKVAEKQIEVTKGSHYPSLDLTSNYYLTRTGILQTSKWDVGVAVVMPLFQGGGVQAAVKESVELKRVAELDTHELKRSAERDLAVLYQNYQKLQIQLSTIKDALKKAKEAYELNRRDYRYGQVTNLDVLQSLNLFIETKRSYNNLNGLAHMTYKNLEASVGVLP